MLTPEQQSVFNALKDGKNVFLTGSGGTGKTYLINTIYEKLPIIRHRDSGLGIRIAVTAMTGCAALLIGSHAKTLHSWAGIGLGKGTVDEILYKIRRNGRAKKNWSMTDILILDEVSMLQPDLLEKLDMIGRIMRKNRSRPFGGIQLLFIGDFFQLPPVTRSGDTHFAFEYSGWSSLFDKYIQLTHIQRQQDPVFQQVLHEARFGDLSAESVTILRSRMNLDWRNLRIRPTLLFPRRAEVDLINDANLRSLEGTRQTYKATLSYDDTVQRGFNSKDETFQSYLHTFDRDAGYLAELVLGIGAQVMLIKNLDATSSLVNGSRGVVTDFLHDQLRTPVVEFMNGMKLAIEPTKWEIEDYPGVYRVQIPLRLAYAITTHKSQGATLDCALIDIGDKIFEYGQAYVALSRVKSLSSLYIHDFDPDAIRAHPKVVEFYRSLHTSESVSEDPPTESDPTSEPETMPAVVVNKLPPVHTPSEPTGSDSNWLFASVPHAWASILEPHIHRLEEISNFLEDKQYLPARENIWHSLSLTDPSTVRVVILGQDPYPTPGHANGLAFSVTEGTRPLPPSLRNIYKELSSDIGTIRTSGCLDDWARQGILLLNTVLTVEPGKPQSHAKIGWEQITDTIISSLKSRNVVFVLWGKSAQVKKKILGSGEYIIESAHPSPLSAHNGFFGSKPFSQINDKLTSLSHEPICW
jgi:ATP-dependent DNA helicase PIF1